ncbi:MAG: DUF2807 domain-containing protein [Chitinophagaceae bacterium]|uniref:head GIN domain-containing protein n=1 Tax=unclassified Paraflavitalea TaxID=2798305 RepID=UPI003D335D73|nr:DUF2807 domain-containing protein [Chitinophagaceae bacterium]
MKKIILALFVISFVASCSFIGGKRIKGNGNITTQSRNVSGFDAVDVSGALDVYVSQDSQFSVKLEGDDNLLQYILIEEHGGTLEVKTKNGVNLRPSSHLKIFVSAPNYKSIEVSGACDIIGEEKLVNKTPIRFDISGAGEVKMDIDAPEVSAGISGSGTVKLTGETRKVKLNLTGAADAHCFDLKAEEVEVDISGAGDADVFASLKLDASVSGAGSVQYRGGATDISQHVSGAGSVKKAD